MTVHYLQFVCEQISSDCQEISKATISSLKDTLSLLETSRLEAFLLLHSH